MFSFNHWTRIGWLDGTPFEGKSFFDLLDHLAVNIMLPLGGILICLFAGWVMSESSSRDELGMRHPFVYGLWRMLARYVAPAGMILVFLHVLGVF